MMDFLAAKELFADSGSNRHYVALDDSRIAYSKLVHAAKNPFKLILLYGRPGTGKSYLLQRFYDTFKEELPLFFYKEPTFEVNNTLGEIFESLTGTPMAEGSSLQTILGQFKVNVQQPIYILLDEAQLYDDTTLEWIRILSNDPLFQFVISVHKMEGENLLAQEHFKTRMFEIIELRPLSSNEVADYIKTKLFEGNELELLSLFSKSNYRLIYRLSGGNLRDINRLIGRLFDILEIKWESARSFFGGRLKNKYIELAALDLKMRDG